MNRSTTLDFITAPSKSLNLFFQMLPLSPTVESQTEDGLFTWCTRIAHPWFNGVLATRAPRSDEGANIQKMVSYFEARKIDIFTLWLEDLHMADAWAKHLQPAGFEISQGPPGMSVNLAELPDSAATPDSFRIELVKDLSMLKTWMTVFVPGFGLPDHFIDAYYRVMSSFGTEMPVRSYLGYLKDEPVATSTLVLTEGIAGIYNVATLEKARGQGLGAAITLQPLLEARERGYSIGALQSSEMGFRVYQRLGFQKVSDIVHFYRTIP